MLNLAVTNVANNGKEIFVWHRSGKTLSLFKDNSYFPYFYQIDPKGLFKTIDGKRVAKIFCSRPSDVSKRRDENSYEADVLYYRRYVIDKIGSFLPCELKYSFIDIEVQCYDKETEVLTDKGWKCFKELDKTDRIAQLDKNNKLIFDFPKNIINKEYDGEMFSIENAKINLHVTKGHKIYVSKRKNWKFSKEQRKDYKFELDNVENVYNGDKKVIFKTSVDWKGLNLKYFILPECTVHRGFRHEFCKEKQILWKDWLKFLGFWLAEGSSTQYKSEHRIDIVQKNNKFVIYELRDLLIKWGFNPHIFDREGILQLSVHNQQLYNYLKQFGKSHDKFVPNNIKVLNSNLINIFLKYFALGDGSSTRELLYTSSPRLANDLQELILKSGKSSRIYGTLQRGQKSKIYRIFIDTVHHYPMTTKLDWKKYHYKGKVYCVTVNSPNILVIRRHGKVVLCGNCPELPSILNPIYPISCISCSNSYTNEIKTLYLGFYTGLKKTDVADYTTEHAEKDLLLDFINWIKTEKFDFLAGWNFIDFDYQYLRARYYKLFGEELADKLSPINSNRIIGKKDEEDPLKIPTGLGIVDYLAWFKKIYKGRHSYALDYIAQEELKETAYEKVDFNVLSDKVKEKNINDVRRMIDIEKKLKIINYFDELRRMSKSDWQDLDWNSKMLDMMLLTEARQKGIVLPSKKYGIESDETFEGAYRRCDTGLYKNLWKLDLSSAYPMAIINFCLDVQNIKENEGIDINGTKFYQNSNALLPSLARKLIIKKDDLKKQLKTIDLESNEAKDLQIKYDAVKGVVNSLFGVCGLKVFRLFDMRVAGAITFIVRDLLHYIEAELEKRSVKIIYIDTDSVFVDSKENPKDMLNQLIIQWAKEKYNKDNIGIEFDLEGRIKKILIVALCRYIAEVETKKGLKKEIKGVEVKRSDSSKYMKYFQETLIDKIMNEESREAIEVFIASEKEAIKQRPLIEIGFPCKLSAKDDYKSPPIFTRGLTYTQEILPSFKKVPGDSFYYIPIEPFGTSIRKSSRKKKGIVELQQSETNIDKNVLCFDEHQFEHINNIDWKQVIKKSINSKVEKIFAAMKWEEIKCPINLNVQPLVDITIERRFSPPVLYYETALGKLYNCDCRDLLHSLADNSVDMIFTSPPYNTGGTGKNKGMYKTYSDNLPDEQYYNLLKDMLLESLRICKGPIFINLNYMSNNKKVLYRFLSDFSEYLRENIIWKKDRIQPPIGNILGKRYEYIFLFTKDPKFQINNFRENKAKNYTAEFGNWISNLIEVSLKTDQTKYNKINRAGFPLALPKMFIDIYTKENDIILDPFMGMGTTAIASEQLNRRWIGSELLEHSCEIIKEELK